MTEPKIRFKRDDGSAFPDWEEKTLGELGCFTKGASLSKADISDDGNPFVLYGELYTTYNEVAYEIKRKTQAEVDKKYYSKVGDVVIPTSGESPEEISTATCIMVPNVILAGDLNIYRSEKIDGRVISYIINHHAKNKIARIAQGKSVVHIQAKQLEKIEVSYPTDEREQQKIADFLSNVDEVIAASEEEVANLEQQKKAVMQKIFSQEVRFKKPDGSDFPDWEEKKLEDILDYEQPTRYIVNNTDYSDDYSIPVLTAGQSLILGYTNEDNGIYNATKESPVIIFDDFTTSFHWIDFSFKVKSSAMKMLTLKSNDCVFKYVLNAMRNIEYSPASHSRQWIATYSQFFIPYPHPDEQQLIADFLTSYDEAITAAKQELEKWKELKKGLLQQMFV